MQVLLVEKYMCSADWEIGMGCCYGSQKSSNSKSNSNSGSGKYGSLTNSGSMVEEKPDVQEAINRLEKSKESQEHELEELKQKLKGTK